MGADPSRPRRARLDPVTRRAQLVATAVAQLDEQGLAAVGVEDVADAAGVSRSLVYAYFGDRDGLAAEVYACVLDRLDAETGLDLPADAEGLLAAVTGAMHFAQSNREAWRMLVGDPCRQHPTARQARADRALRIAAGWTRPVDPEPDADAGADLAEPAGNQLAAEAALGMLETGVQHWLDHPDLPPEQAAGLLATLLWSGLTARPG